MGTDQHKKKRNIKETGRKDGGGKEKDRNGKNGRWEEERR